MIKRGCKINFINSILVKAGWRKRGKSRRRDKREEMTRRKESKEIKQQTKRGKKEF